MATTAQHPAGPGHALPARLVEAWRTAYLGAKAPDTAGWLWHRVLTADDRRRLGGDLDGAYARYGGAAGMWRHLRGVSVPQAVVEVATRYGRLDAATGRALLREFGEEPDDPAAAVESAVASGALVLVEVPRELYWAGEAVPVEWGRHAALWALVWELARASKAGAAVDEYVLRGGASTDPKYTTKLKSRLVRVAGFPATLAARVVSAGRGTYRLDLPPSRIRVFERGAGDSVREWTR